MENESLSIFCFYLSEQGPEYTFAVTVEQNCVFWSNKSTANSLRKFLLKLTQDLCTGICNM